MGRKGKEKHESKANVRKRWIREEKKSNIVTGPEITLVLPEMRKANFPLLRQMNGRNLASYDTQRWSNTLGEREGKGELEGRLKERVLMKREAKSGKFERMRRGKGPEWKGRKGMRNTGKGWNESTESKLRMGRKEKWRINEGMEERGERRKRGRKLKVRGKEVKRGEEKGEK